MELFHKKNTKMQSSLAYAFEKKTMGFEVSHVSMLKGSKNGELLKDIMT
jgi:hypothetical protein